MKNSCRQQAALSRADGFTLVELAIALVIIGLLIGGVLKGQELIDNARVSRIATQMKSYETAAITFFNTYNSLPGDIENPSQRVPGCGTAPCSAVGNEDGGIATSPSWPGGMLAVTWGGNTSEQYNFWLHLAKAGLISGIDQNWTTFTGTPGVDVPAIPTDQRGAFIVKSWGYANMDHMPTYLRAIAATAIGASAMMDAQPYVMSPHQVVQIDQKLDDGVANSGTVTGYGGCAVGAGAVYDGKNTEKACDMLYQMVLPD